MYTYLLTCRILWPKRFRCLQNPKKLHSNGKTFSQSERTRSTRVRNGCTLSFSELVQNKGSERNTAYRRRAQQESAQGRAHLGAVKLDPRSCAFQRHGAAVHKPRICPITTHFTIRTSIKNIVIQYQMLSSVTMSEFCTSKRFRGGVLASDNHFSTSTNENLFVFVLQPKG